MTGKLRPLYVAVLYVVLWVASDLAASHLHPTPGFSAWYPGAALTFFLFARYGVRYAPLLVAGELIRWSLGHSPMVHAWVPIAEGCIVTATYGSTIAVLQRRFHLTLPIARTRDAVLFSIGTCVGSGLTAAASILLYTSATEFRLIDFVTQWRYFALGDAVAILALVPVLAWLDRDPAQGPVLDARQTIPTLGETALAIAVGLLGSAAYGALALNPLWLVPFALTFLPLGVLAWRSGFRGAILGALFLDVSLVVMDAFSRVPEQAVARGQLGVVLQSILAFVVAGVAESRMRDKRELETLKFRDHRTLLPNRRAFERWSQLHGDGHMWVVCLSPDHFPVLDVGAGEDAANDLLLRFAERIATAVEPHAFFGRSEATDFVLAGTGTLQDALEVAKRIDSRLEMPFEFRGANLRMTASLGVSAGLRSAATLVVESHDALRRARSFGGNRTEVHAPSDVPAGGTLFQELLRARDRKEFELYYQPIHQLHAGRRIVGMEALLRWSHPVHGVLTPSYFLEELERSGLLEEIEPWIVLEATRFVSQAVAESGVTLWLNVSRASLLNPAFAARTVAIARANGLAPSQVVIEVTERLVAQDDATAGAIAQFARAGMSIAIDDFGTGHSSLSRMRSVDADYVKLDRSLIVPVESDERGRTVATATVGLIRRLNAQPVAEGIETEAQAEFFARAGCRYGQGYAFSVPMPEHEARTALASVIAG